ncbi:methionyl-tRNA formyltransferase [Natrinema salsiterrestre]|uniref:Formyl transferase N-terminal domain-containing protein n=1 Tax=Natrinema salsiterrestre TaxID=2950540 RepID=A0A9Q4L0L6_9EURY|nr:formyltransferase family protein [Natrinema salsiterrestre]MDF9745836.1 hypothetical protein [Natrinema salsiterrestre]
MSNERPFRVLIITIQEYYYIPLFLRPVLESDGFEVCGVVTMPPTLGSENTVRFAAGLFRRFGPRVFAKHVRFFGKYALRDCFARYTGRGHAYSASTLARRHGIPHRHVTDVSSESFRSYVESLEPMLVASVAATQRFDGDLLAIPEVGAINLHSSLLPEYRGVSPSFWTLLHDESETGVTAHYMNEQIDGGDIVRQQSLPIEDDDTLHSLNRRVAERGSEVLLDAIGAIRDGMVDPEPMDVDGGSYYSLPDREDVRDFLRSGNQFY